MRCFLQGLLLLSILLRMAGEPPSSTCDHRLSRTHGHLSQGVRQGSSRPKALRPGLVTWEQRQRGSGVPGQEVLGGARGTLPHDVGEQVGASAISLGGGCDGHSRRPGEGAGSFEEKWQCPGGLGWRVSRGPWCDWSWPGFQGGPGQQSRPWSPGRGGAGSRPGVGAGSGLSPLPGPADRMELMLSLCMGPTYWWQPQPRQRRGGEGLSGAGCRPQGLWRWAALLTLPDSLRAGVLGPTSQRGRPGGHQLPWGPRVPRPTLAGQQPRPGSWFRPLPEFSLRDACAGEDGGCDPHGSQAAADPPHPLLAWELGRSSNVVGEAPGAWGGVHPH